MSTGPSVTPTTRIPATGVGSRAVLGLIGAGCHLDRNLSFVSELSSRDQPHHLLFQAFDLAAGLLIAALGLGLHRGLPAGPGRAWGWGSGSVVAFERPPPPSGSCPWTAPPAPAAPAP